MSASSPAIAASSGATTHAFWERLWRTRGVHSAVYVLVLLGGTTWLSSGIWAPDGAYSRFISPAIGLVWLAGVSGILLPRTPGGRSGW